MTDIEHTTTTGGAMSAFGPPIVDAPVVAENARRRRWGQHADERGQ